MSYAIRAIVLEKNHPLVGVRVRVNFRVGGQFSSGAIVLEPIETWLENRYFDFCYSANTLNTRSRAQYCIV